MLFTSVVIGQSNHFGFVLQRSIENSSIIGRNLASKGLALGVGLHRAIEACIRTGSYIRNFKVLLWCPGRSVPIMQGYLAFRGLFSHMGAFCIPREDSF